MIRFTDDELIANWWRSRMSDGLGRSKGQNEAMKYVLQYKNAQMAELEEKIKILEESIERMESTDLQAGGKDSRVWRVPQ